MSVCGNRVKCHARGVNELTLESKSHICRMILEVCTNPRKIRHNRNSEGSQQSRGANTAELQDLCRVHCSSG